jgi:uncharacterized protein
MSAPTARYPGRAPIDAYGNGGFRFAGMSHRGSILCLPSGIYAWHASDGARLGPDDFERAFAERDDIAFLLLGTGRTQIFPTPELARAFAAAGLGLEPMDTGAACRTFNILLGEGRRVAAAPVAVE